MDWDAILMAVNSDPSKPLNDGGVKIVKSRQIGRFTRPNDNTYQNFSIAISEVNPLKCIVQISCSNSDAGSSIISFTNTTLNVATCFARGAETYTYEITEFY